MKNIQFWVYENFRKLHARVHLRNCSCCNDGAGTNKIKGKENGKWVDPFNTYNEAENEAKRFIKEKNCEDKKINCSFCEPQS
ncbi:hypothetical protein [Treponema sp.]|uniref:hypothetical protein n=1 Tax=Treponema sp. TaxID=166 RepID=UPI003F07E8AF